MPYPPQGVGSPGAPVVNAGAFTAGIHPTDQANAAGSADLMMGFGATVHYTPTLTGKIMGFWTAMLETNTAQSGGQINLNSIRYGTGTAPVNGAALTGTKATSHAAITTPIAQYTFGTVTISGVFDTSFCLPFFITGLTLSTAYWIDTSMSNNLGVAAQQVNNVVWLYELAY